MGEVKEKTLEECIETYLECEALLKEFFGELSFCYENCVSQKKSLFKDFEGYLGCCLGSHYDGLDYEWEKLFQARREELYGKPKDHNDKCGYHSDDRGCTLDSYKPPVCIAYVCDKQKNYIRERFGVDYDLDKSLLILYSVLREAATEKEVSDFKAEIKAFTDIIRSEK